MKANNLQTWQQETQARMEMLLANLMPSENQLPEKLHQAMRYVTLGGGKRLRPLLVFATAELGNANLTACEHAAAAIEFIHVYSLVHDDMPAMDNDNLRRGKPTCHIQYDEATALLVGDALQSLAFDLLSRPTDLPSARQLKMLATLAQAAGSLGMAGGQAIDLDNVGNSMTQAQLEQMHSLKTGALIRAAVALGALSCPDLNDSQLQKLDHYAKYLGLAFQVIDDVLDCEADTTTLGKTAGKDADNDKPTYVKLMGLTAARQYAESLITQAIAQLEIFDHRAQRLRELAQFVVQRQY